MMLVPINRWMKHIHHKIPRHAGGTDDPENLIELTIEEHAEAHRLLYEKHGREEDRIAWLGLSAQIGKEEIMALVTSMAGHKGKSTLYAWHKKLSGATYEELYGSERAAELKKNRKERFTGEGNPQFGIPRTEEWRKTHSEGMIGEKHFNYGKPAFNRGTTWVTRGPDNKMIPVDELELYESTGWRRGRYYKTKPSPPIGMKGRRHSEETKQKMRNRAQESLRIRKASRTDPS